MSKVGQIIIIIEFHRRNSIRPLNEQSINLLFNFIKETRNIRFVPSINSLRWNSPPGNPPLKLLRIKKIETLGEAEPHQNRRAIFRACHFPW